MIQAPSLSSFVMGAYHPCGNSKTGKRVLQILELFQFVEQRIEQETRMLVPITGLPHSLRKND
jgi:hypothetical protein